MSPPNDPARPAPLRAGVVPEPALEREQGSGPGALSPTQHVQTSLLELEDLLDDLKAKKVPSPINAAPLENVLDAEFVDEEKPGGQRPAGMPTIGDLIGGTYLVEGELGSGAMGVVLLAVDQRLKRKVAIKVIQSSLLAKHFHDRFLLEARAMAEVNHPNVLVIHAFGEHG